MEICIISKEIIKPSSPTPPHLRTYKLSLIDQLALHTHFGFLLFYSKIDKNIINNISSLLKLSLSKTLTHYYPFAGRVRDDFSIDCDDSGVPFIEANIAINMSEILKKPEMSILEELMPYNPNEEVSITQANFSIQLNYFDCGGVAICVCLRHVVADGSALAHFFKNWATIARGFGDNIEDVIFDSTSIFPPKELATTITSNVNKAQYSTNYITKRFIFDGRKIATLKEQIKNKSKFNPTRMEVVSALIWGALISMTRESDDASPTLVIILNIRKRMNLPFPQQCIGNAVYSVTGNWVKNDPIDCNNLAKNIHQLILTVKDGDVRQYYNIDTFEEQISRETDEFASDSDKLNYFGITSLCGLPFYEADFGWGRPTWKSVCFKFNNLASLVDASD
ncbi:Vinorine synthase [Melia azedarach]|uniref:Vinorine synthase n=1 Tax=Melia azedarach TaxID=155640 RepID=A0ACC1XQ93_MELAZ|nr:Vinorine synthase [Melia azedarach]